jgi:hypothetical protein
MQRKASVNIQKNLGIYLHGDETSGGLKPTERYASFDYCYNYFQSFREQNNIPTLAARDQMQISCLQIAFYLASWGMLRASSFLLQKSAKHYEPLIEAIVNFPRNVWDIDVDSYTEENIDLLLECKQVIGQKIGQDWGVTITLATKIMLGVFGNVPAFDDRFKRGFGAHTFSRGSLGRIAEFYEQNKAIIDSRNVYTLDFATGQPTHRMYPKAKLIDMVYFIEGQPGRVVAERKAIEGGGEESGNVAL